MRNVIHLRLAVVLLDQNHAMKGIAMAEGQPRHAVRRACEQAVKLMAWGSQHGYRIVIIPAGCGVMERVIGRAQAFSKAGLSLPAMDAHDVRKVSRLAALQAFYGLCAEQVRADQAKPVQGVVLQRA